MMVVAHIYVEKGDLVGTGRKGSRPFREFVVSYRKVHRSSDLGLGRIKYLSAGYAGRAIAIARELAKGFLKDGIYSRIYVSDCKKRNGTYEIDEKGRFRKVK